MFKVTNLNEYRSSRESAKRYIDFLAALIEDVTGERVSLEDQEVLKELRLRIEKKGIRNA